MNRNDMVFKYYYLKIIKEPKCKVMVKNCLYIFYMKAILNDKFILRGVVRIVLNSINKIY